MKKSLSYRLIGIGFIFISITSCNKDGLGGTASIEGVVMGMDHSYAKNEITQVSFTNGNSVEHGDYWLLNSPDLNNYFYIWYDNPTWISNGDPGLQGRIGIKVSFNYSDSNIEIATRTMEAIANTTSIFDMVLDNDILILTCTMTGECPDAKDMTSPFAFDIAQQGHNAYLGASEPLVDEKVYIKYGDSEYHNDIEQTSMDGKFRFTNLSKGNYTVFTFSKDTINNVSETIEQHVEITENGQAYVLEDFVVIY